MFLLGLSGPCSNKLRAAIVLQTTERLRDDFVLLLHRFQEWSLGSFVLVVHRFQERCRDIFVLVIHRYNEDRLGIIWTMRRLRPMIALLPPHFVFVRGHVDVEEQAFQWELGGLYIVKLMIRGQVLAWQVWECVGKSRVVG